MKKLIIALFAFFCVFDANAQGLNNNYPLDSVDVKNVFTMLGVEVFKFPFENKNKLDYIKLLEKKGKSQYLKLYYEVWKNDSLVVTYNTTGGLDEMIKNNYLSMDKDNRIVRLYDRQLNDTTVLLMLDINGIIITQDFIYPQGKYGMHNSRAFSDFQPEPGKKKPIYVRTFVDKKQTIMHCPAGRTKEIITKDYPYVIFLIAEIEETDKADNR
jgi:hypothetical protein